MAMGVSYEAVVLHMALERAVGMFTVGTSIGTSEIYRSREGNIKRGKSTRYFLFFLTRKRNKNRAGKRWGNRKQEEKKRLE